MSKVYFYGVSALAVCVSLISAANACDAVSVELAQRNGSIAFLKKVAIEDGIVIAANCWLVGDNDRGQLNTYLPGTDCFRPGSSWEGRTPSVSEQDQFDMSENEAVVTQVALSSDLANETTTIGDWQLIPVPSWGDQQADQIGEIDLMPSNRLDANGHHLLPDGRTVGGA